VIEKPPVDRADGHGIRAPIEGSVQKLTEQPLEELPGSIEK